VENNVGLIEFLKKDEIKNLNIIGFLENNSICIVERIGNSMLVKGTSDRDWIYISSSDEEELNILKNKLDKNDKNFGAIEDWMVPILIENKSIEWDFPLVQYYLPADCKVPRPEIHTEPLIKEDAKIIFENSEYQNSISLEYSEEQIEKGITAGIRLDGRLAAWCITQDDGGLGFLHVLPEYRRKRYGYHVTLALIEVVRKKGKIPFAYILEDNVKSINLITKLGFKKDKKIHWFGIK